MVGQATVRGIISAYFGLLGKFVFAKPQFEFRQLLRLLRKVLMMSVSDG